MVSYYFKIVFHFVIVYFERNWLIFFLSCWCCIIGQQPSFRLVFFLMIFNNGLFSDDFFNHAVTDLKGLKMILMIDSTEQGLQDIQVCQLFLASKESPEIVWKTLFAHLY